MRVVNKNLLKFIYSGLLCTVPQYSMNPINQNRILAELNIKPYSTYINYKLNENQVELLNNYVKNYSKELDLVPIKSRNKKIKNAMSNSFGFGGTNASLIVGEVE